jgi:hypothetical protein
MTEAEIATHSVKDLNIESIASDISERRQVLEEAEVAQRKSFLRFTPSSSNSI